MRAAFGHPIHETARDCNTMYPGRGLPSSNVAPSFIGLQVHANPRS
jgi:hypothetical protein